MSGKEREGGEKRCKRIEKSAQNGRVRVRDIEKAARMIEK